MIKQFALASTILLFLVAGCASTYTIRTNEDSPNEVFLIFSKGTNAQPGDKFVVYRTRTMSSSSSSMGGHQYGGHGSGSHALREEIGKVEIIEVVDNTYAKVKVLVGTVENDAHAEKLIE